ncbi:MAG: hypothetical protein EZS28_001221 [Streblomastix strix]|uniref:Uncharacterized protein n=1 Tax=Streblomastix strix TaxID=222440 RepID=A0A5J4X8X3_9EUKA|nr:MAG: hypothetical protein EZS28_001220 [Streblomastix strix]KAA6403256.1 MAG: hypothetical protein EZS28_001221 [Streblomastix strix]
MDSGAYQRTNHAKWLTAFFLTAVDLSTVLEIIPQILFDVEEIADIDTQDYSMSIALSRTRAEISKMCVITSYSIDDTISLSARIACALTFTYASEAQIEIHPNAI